MTENRDTPRGQQVRPEREGQRAGRQDACDRKRPDQASTRATRQRFQERLRREPTPQRPAFRCSIGARCARRADAIDSELPRFARHGQNDCQIALGRRNWLFAWTELGAEYVGILQSLLQTCRLQGISPYRYLVDVLQRVDSHPASEVALLTPRLWKEHFGQDPLLSPLERYTGRVED